MARILRRPMFRKGGSTNEGIMHGLVNRRGYDIGSRTEEIVAAQEKYAPIPKSRFPMGQIGLNLVSGRYAGDGLLQNVAGSAMDPYRTWTERDDARNAAMAQRRGAAVSTVVGQQHAERLLRQKNDPSRALYNVYLKQAIDDGYDGPAAERYATYQSTMKRDLENKVGANRVADDIIDFDLTDRDKNKRKIANLKKHVGKYFYDIREGNIKKITVQDGKVGWIAYNSVAAIALGDLQAEAPTQISTPYADAQAAIEQEKSEGILTDEDIIAQRFP